MDFSARLDALGRWLGAHGPLWRERPFVALPVSWEEDEPAVAAALRRLSEDEVDELEADLGERPWMPAAFNRWVREAREHSALGRHARLPVELPRPRRVPGRKWEQIVPFAGAVLAAAPRSVSEWVDYCAGKGHLGRALARLTGARATCLERDVALCSDGTELASAEGALASFVRQDVLAVDVAARLGPGVGAVALHACGDLHLALLRSFLEGEAAFLAMAPCCYHRTERSAYRPLSRAAQGADPRLAPSQLRLVGLEEVVASTRRKALRRREQAFRLGFDLLVREATGEDRYRPLGPVRHEVVEGPFEHFCRSLAVQHDLSIPRGTRFHVAERRGWERLRLARALGLVRGIFRKPLETWILLDLAEHLREGGLRVSLASFCSPEVTPRNAAVLACRRG